MDRIETTAAGRDAAPTPIPPPHPPQDGRKAFLVEIAIVVIGVLLALAAQQIVEWLNWQSEVKESRDAIDKELAYNLGSRKARNDNIECVDRRLDDLQRWHDSWVQGRPLKPVVPIDSLRGRTILFDAWQVTQTGQVAAHMPLEDRINYAKLYSFLRTYDANSTRELTRWAELQKFEGATQLDHRDLMELQGLIIALRGQNDGFKLNWPIFERAARLTGVSPDLSGINYRVRLNAGICAPLFGSASAKTEAVQP